MNSIVFDYEKLKFFVVTPDGKRFSATIPKEKKGIKDNKINRYRIEVSLACDLKCKYCVVHMNRVFQMGKIMNEETARKIMGRFRKEVGKDGSLMLIGGEPLLNWRIVKLMIELCPGKTMIFTNALSLNEEKINFLKEHQTLILTSLDGYSIRHNSSRFYPEVKKNFQIVKDNIKAMISAGCNVGIGCVAHSGNVADLGKIADFFVDDLGAHSISFSYPHFTVEKSDTNFFNMGEYSKQMKKMLAYSKKRKVYIDQIGKLVRSILTSDHIFSSCKAGISQRAFYPDGTETICTKLDTIPGYDFKNFYSSMPFNNQKCSSCIAKNVCGGGCPWDAAIKSNNKGVDNRICKYNKGLVSFIIKDIAKELRHVKTQKEAVSVLKEKYEPVMSPIWINE